MAQQTAQMTSRERVLAAMRRQPVDYAPCSPCFNPLHESQRVGRRYQFPWGPSQDEQLEYCVDELGVDPVVNCSAGGHRTDPDVSSNAWLDGSMVHKAYTTPAGELRASATYDESWPHGLDIPFFSDFNPSHCTKFWIETDQDVECLRHIMQPLRGEAPSERQRSSFAETKGLADRMRLATICHLGTGLTGALQMFGPTNLCLAVADNPTLVHAYLELEHQVNLRNIEIALDLGVDIVRRNGFYETCDLYSPAMLEEFLFDRLQREIALVHQGGKVTTYTVHTGIMPMLDYLRRLDFDCLMHIDIAFHGVDLEVVRDSQQETKSFWIGPSSTYQLQEKDPEVTREAVRECFRVFGREGLLITACPSAHSIMPWENTLAMIDEWSKLR